MASVRGIGAPDARNRVVLLAVTSRRVAYRLIEKFDPV